MCSLKHRLTDNLGHWNGVKRNVGENCWWNSTCDWRAAWINASKIYLLLKVGWLVWKLCEVLLCLFGALDLDLDFAYLCALDCGSDLMFCLLPETIKFRYL